MKLFQITYKVPYPPTDGGAIGIYNITKGLSEAECEVHTLAINTPKHSQPANALSGIAHQYDVFVDTSISPIKLLWNCFFKTIPYNVERFISTTCEEKIVELIQKENFDIIQIEGTFVAHYIETIRQVTNVPVVIRAHNIEYVIWDRLSKNNKNLLKRFYFASLAKRLRFFEKKYYNKFDAIAAITSEDKQRLMDIGVTKPIEVIPAGVIVDKFSLDPSVNFNPNSLFILGALDWIPNQEALFWFLENVWPELTVKYPNITLHIAGKNTPDRIMNLKLPNVHVHGFVDDVVEFIKTYNLMLVPLLSGGGMRIKIIEGMAAGKCIITTKVGAEGIEYTNMENIVICNTKDEWIEKIGYYIENDNARKLIADNALKLVTELYDNRTITNKYITFYKSCMNNR